jgi:phage terminase large subunit GpA-like protein
VPLFVLCVDTGKDIVFSRLRIPSPGPGFVHLPDWVDEEYLAQLTAEKAIWKYVKGRGAVREWVKLRERNEALDLEVYALAALYIGGQSLLRSLEDRAAAFARPVSEIPKPEDEQPRLMARRSGWIQRRPGWVRNL